MGFFKMFNTINRIKAKNIRNTHDNLSENEFLRVFTAGGVPIDILYKESFEINEISLKIDKLEAYTELITFHDVLKMPEK